MEHSATKKLYLYKSRLCKTAVRKKDHDDTRPIINNNSRYEQVAARGSYLFGLKKKRVLKGAFAKIAKGDY